MDYLKRMKRYFYSYKLTKFDDNDILATRSIPGGIFEVHFWASTYEVYYRPLKKRYGYLLAYYDDLSNAINFMNHALPFVPNLYVTAPGVIVRPDN